MENKLSLHSLYCKKCDKKNRKEPSDGTNIAKRTWEKNSDPLIKLFINMMNIKLNEK